MQEANGSASPHLENLHGGIVAGGLEGKCARWEGGGGRRRAVHVRYPAAWSSIARPRSRPRRTRKPRATAWIKSAAALASHFGIAAAASRAPTLELPSSSSAAATLATRPREPTGPRSRCTARTVCPDERSLRRCRYARSRSCARPALASSAARRRRRGGRRRGGRLQGRLEPRVTEQRRRARPLRRAVRERRRDERDRAERDRVPLGRRELGPALAARRDVVRDLFRGARAEGGSASASSARGGARAREMTRGTGRGSRACAALSPLNGRYPHSSTCAITPTDHTSASGPYGGAPGRRVDDLGRGVVHAAARRRERAVLGREALGDAKVDEHDVDVVARAAQQDVRA